MESCRRLRCSPVHLDEQTSDGGRSCLIVFESVAEKMQYLDYARAGQLRIGGTTLRAARVTPKARLAADLPFKAVARTLELQGLGLQIYWPERLALDSATGVPLARTQWHNNVECSAYLHPSIGEDTKYLVEPPVSKTVRSK